MQVEKWQMQYQVIGLMPVQQESRAAGSLVPVRDCRTMIEPPLVQRKALAVIAETVEEEAAQKMHDYYEARGIQTIVVKLEIPW